MILESLSFATNVQKSVPNVSFQHHFSGIESRRDLQRSEEEVIFFKTNRAVNDGRLKWLTKVYDSSRLRGGKLSGLGDLCGSWHVKRSHLEMSGFQMFSEGRIRLFLFRWTDLSHWFYFPRHLWFSPTKPYGLEAFFETIKKPSKIQSSALFLRKYFSHVCSLSLSLWACIVRWSSPRIPIANIRIFWIQGLIFTIPGLIFWDPQLIISMNWPFELRSKRFASILVGQYGFASWNVINGITDASTSSCVLAWVYPGMAIQKK